jgi:hypothetical protein
MIAATKTLAGTDRGQVGYILKYFLVGAQAASHCGLAIECSVGFVICLRQAVCRPAMPDWP